MEDTKGFLERAGTVGHSSCTGAVGGGADRDMGRFVWDLGEISPDDGDIHLITFYSCSMQPAELNYEIYDKVLPASLRPSNHGTTTWKALHMLYSSSLITRTSITL